MKLTNPTLDEIDAAVAQKVAGWRRGIHAGDWYRDDDGYPPNTMFCTTAEAVKPFSRSADAVLPLLEKEDAIITHSVNECDWRVVLTRGRCNSAKTLALAACIALLRAHGVEVEFTSHETKETR